MYNDDRFLNAARDGYSYQYKVLAVIEKIKLVLFINCRNKK